MRVAEDARVVLAVESQLDRESNDSRSRALRGRRGVEHAECLREILQRRAELGERESGVVARRVTLQPGAEIARRFGGAMVGQRTLGAREKCIRARIVYTRPARWPDDVGEGDARAELAVKPPPRSERNRAARENRASEQNEDEPAEMDEENRFQRSSTRQRFGLEVDAPPPTPEPAGAVGVLAGVPAADETEFDHARSAVGRLGSAGRAPAVSPTLVPRRDEREGAAKIRRLR